MSNENVIESTDDTAAGLEESARVALEKVGIEPAVVSKKDCSYRMLLDAGVEESVADSLRRQFSLPWSFTSEGDLDRRSSEVRGLGAAEREWVAASADSTWQAFESASSRAAETETASDTERPWPEPTPITQVAGVSPEKAQKLAEAGITSAERLATIPARDVATALDLNVLHVRTWRYNARELFK
ncbi:hypothetical protein [Natronosalvus hydrolyticus]|uniref:hypothetical protein n=1 Tax=Natronosalvus hydrolyticus TaxID=2979988 RepID=UPI00319EB0EF